MKHFAVESGKSKGQFYTPAEVSRVMAKVIDANKATGKMQTVYDPTCGSGSLLLKVADEAPRGISIYGQELDNSTAGLAALNTWLHGKPEADIKKGQSTLSNPLFIEHGTLKTFDYVVANPPFSYKAWRTGFSTEFSPENDRYGRFDGFGVPPKKNGDFAFLLHILKSLKSTGTGAVILPHGVLFRGNAEAEIRKNIIERGYIKGIIGLPANLFYGTGIPACIIVLDKAGARDRKGIFMIDASKGFVKDGNKNRLREQDIRKIVDAWNGRLEVARYSRFVLNKEIEKNEYNLNLPRYIDTQEPEDIQDIEAHLKGGIPKADINAFSAYWEICPALRKSLFKDSKRKGYAELAIANDEVKKTILSHPEFADFRSSVLKTFAAWQKKTTLFLKGIGTADHPKAIIQKIADELLAACANLHLIDKYDIYQHLMAYWEEAMQDDAHIITVDGWNAGKEVIRLQKESKGRKKDVEGLAGLEGRLIPISLAIKTYFVKEQGKLDELNATLEQIDADMDALKDEHGSEEGLLAEVIENDKISKGVVQKRIREIANDADYTDELKVLGQYLALFEKEAETKKAIKDIEKELEQKVLAKYPALTLEEIKTLAMEHKWMDELSRRILSEVDHLSQTLAGRVKELAERYAEPLPQLTQEVVELTAKVESHLAKMGFKKKKHIKQGAMQELLTGKHRLPGFSGEWEEKQLGEVLTIRHGKSQYGVSDRNGSYPILATGGQIGMANKFLYDKPSVLIGRKGTIDQPQFMDMPFWSVDTLFYSEIHEPNSAKFLYYRFCLIDWYQYNEASGVPSLNARTIEQIEMLIPEPKEQTAIAAILSDIDEEIEKLESQLAKYRNLKQGMMQELLTGRIRLVSAKTISQADKDKQITAKPKSHNWEINEAVVISVLTKQFGSEKYPLGRKRYTKLSYLFHRHAEMKAEGYLKKPAGPYNPDTKYKGPEGIAQRNGYIRMHTSGSYSGFVVADNIGKAEAYFQKWYGPEVLRWLEQFRRETNDDLELLATVDAAIQDLQTQGIKITVEAVKNVLRAHSDWEPKLRREIFSDANIKQAIERSQKLFGGKREVTENSRMRVVKKQPS